MPSPRTLVLALSLACVAAATATAQSGIAVSGVAMPDSVGEQMFSLQPGDVLQAKVWREPDLSGTFQVDETGRLNLPMLGTMRVTGRPWPELRDSLMAQYALQLRNPSVVLTPLRRVQVLGEVFRPGQYLADPTLSIAGLVALAGGATPLGDLRHVWVVRNGRTIVPSESIETMVLGSGVQSNDQIFVGKRPWLERNGEFVASAIISTTSILITLIHH